MRRVNISTPDFSFDANDPDGFKPGMFRIGKLLGSSQMGASVYELPPRQALCPYHYEHAEEEWLIVLEGKPTLRHPEGSDVLDPWDVLCFSPGPDGAHGIRNETDEEVRILMFSTLRHPSATSYPDSDKIAIWTEDRTDDLIVHRSSGVDYFSGEAGEPG